MIATKPKCAGLAISAALTVIGGGAAPIVPARAAGVEGPAVVIAAVRYGDLDLRSAAGVAQLDARIRAAAGRLCLEPGVKSLDAARAGLECRDALVAAAAAQVRRAVAAAAAR